MNLTLLNLIELMLTLAGGAYVVKVIERRQRLFAACLLHLTMGHKDVVVSLVKSEFPDLDV